MPEWPLLLRIAFRFCVTFFAITTLYLVIEHISVLVGVLMPSLIPLGERIGENVFLTAYGWATLQLFGANVQYPTIAGFFAYMVTVLLEAGLGTLVWTAVDHRRREYRRAHAWLRIYLRYLLAAVMFSYGMVKVIPAQFPPPSLIQLITPLGEFTRMRLLWLSMGAAPAYSIFTGLCEVSGGLLLFSRRTATLGALIVAASLSNVVALNFAYGVGVQLNSTVYLLMALTLLAPETRRLADVFILRPVASAERHLPRDVWMRRGVTIAKLLVIVWMIGVYVGEAYVARSSGRPAPALYGIYDVETFTRGGVELARGDGARWQRFVVAERDTAAVQTASRPVERYRVRHDALAHTLTLIPLEGQGDRLILRYTHEADGRLLVEGSIRSDAVQAHLRAVDLTQFPLRQPLR
ncbi:MAG: hypothetical protein ACM4AI_08220 [Acidobacteriota bacterium]